MPPARRHIKLMGNLNGFSLLEVLIALVIISIGLLGIAALQGLSISNTGIARTRSLAALEAASLSAAIGANPAYWETTAVPASVIVTGSATSGWASTTLAGASTLNAQSLDCTSNLCTATQMSAYDLKNWGNALAVQLPSGTGEVDCTTIQPISCRVIVRWMEKYLKQSKGSTATTATQDYQLIVQP